MNDDIFDINGKLIQIGNIVECKNGRMGVVVLYKGYLSIRDTETQKVTKAMIHNNSVKLLC